MRHAFVVEGFRFCLRPVAVGDAPFIVSLRSDPERAAFLNAGAQDVEAQERWIRAYEERDGEVYFVIEDIRSGRSEGVIGVSTPVPPTGRGEWGRWIVRRDSAAAYESVFLVMDFAFATLGLDALFCRTVRENARVVSFHDGFGYTERSELAEPLAVSGVPTTLVEHAMTKDTWASIRDGHARRLRRLAGR